MQPSEALETLLTYLAIIPIENLCGGFTHFFLLDFNSSVDMSTSIKFLSASIDIISPSFTKANGPPSWAQEQRAQQRNHGYLQKSDRR